VDVQEVLDTLIPKEMEVKTTEERWYIMRIQPYRTLENVIEGAVITFVEITETVKMREELREANRELLRLAVVVLDANDAITVEGLNGRILAWNPRAEKMYGWSESEALSMNVRDRIPQERQEEVMQIMDKLSHAGVLVPYRTQRLTKEGKLMDVWITCTALVNEDGKIYAVATTEREIKSNNTEIKEAVNV
jgi:two-component system CheB/CheR fusion protein